MEYFTSYYGNLKNIPADYLCVGISRFCPDGLKEGGTENFLWVRGSFLAPSEELLKDFKEGRIGESEYKERFVREFCSGLQCKWKDVPDWIADLENEFSGKYKGVVFLCYEKPGDFCHRHILAKLLTKVYGIPCIEYGEKKEVVSEGLF